VFAMWVTVQVRPGAREEFLTAITEAATAAVEHEPGCLAFDVLELDREDGRYAFYELYRDEAAWRDEHRASAHFAAWRAVADRVLVPDAKTNQPAAVVAAPRVLTAGDAR